jgi:hypothetical protein
MEVLEIDKDLKKEHSIASVNGLSAPEKDEFHSVPGSPGPVEKKPESHQEGDTSGH